MDDQEYEEIIEISPEMAKEWLAKHRNPDNRQTNFSRVREHRDLMAAGRWKVSGEFAICFLRNGRIGNGHHRLHAVVLYGQPVTFVVRRNVHPDALRYIDLHQARTRGQVGRMFGIDTSNDDAIRLIEVAMSGSLERVPELVLEKRRAQLGPAIALVSEHANVMYKKRRLRAGVRAALIAIAYVRQSSAVSFLRSLGPVLARETSTPRATVNLVNWMDGTGAAGSALQMEHIGATVNAFEQCVSGSEQKHVRSDGLSLPGSAARRLFDELKRRLDCQ